jgi:UDPglucose 6-dehydrogenase
MRISIIGSGYVGTTIAACFADMGHNVVNVDINEAIVEAINSGQSPIHEPGLDDLLAAHSGDRLTATTEYDAVLDTEITFLALPTPAREDGSIDTSIIEAAAETLGDILRTKTDHHVVTIKSTVLPTTTSEKLAPILEANSGKTLGKDLHVAMNPEFLREGSAVDDFLDPDKIVLGTDSDVARERLQAVFEPLIEETTAPVVDTGIEEAEMIKYANNGFLAAKVSLINDIGNICKEYGVDAYEVADAIGLDDRISARFLRSGLGWGGSCFPKDTAAIRAAARKQGYEPLMLDAATEINDRQPERLLSLLDSHIDIAGERVAVLGLSFKPGTDDIRNSRAIPVIEGLQARDSDVVAYDPVAADNMRERFPEIEYVGSPKAALEDAAAALVVTDWPEITALDAEFNAMSTPVVVDGRRAIDRRDGIVYEGLTW